MIQHFSLRYCDGSILTNIVSAVRDCRLVAVWPGSADEGGIGGRALRVRPSRGQHENLQLIPAQSLIGGTARARGTLVLG